jgi:cytochrome c biogenesis protein CcmG/thiol:disulfide interchange protein DsbE
MTDLIDQLRTVNPVPTCEMPRLDDVWRKLERESGSDRPTSRRRGPGVWLSYAGVGVVVVVAVLVAVLALEVRHVSDQRPISPAHHAQPKPPIDALDRAAQRIDSALARGAHPLAPSQSMPLPLVGGAGTRTLKDFRGQVVVLNVFASWCQPCKAESAALEQTQHRIAGHRATVLGVSFLSGVAADIEKFMRDEHITYPVLRDPTGRGRFGRSFGIDGVPETFVINRDGRIIAARRYQVRDRWLTQTLARALNGNSTVSR